MSPLDVALILRAFVVSSDLGRTWSRAQSSQDAFAKSLDELKLKRGSGLVAANSGGSRTYEAQLLFLGLIFKDETGIIQLTQAGSDLIKLLSPAKILEDQLLKLQYPSAYSMSRGVNIDQKIKVRPFLFLLELASTKELNGISEKEVTIPIIYGNTDADLDKCRKLITEARNHKNGILSVIPDSKNIRTPRTQANTFAERIKDILNIANTFKNVLQGVGLIELKEFEGEVRIFPSNEVISKLPHFKAKPYLPVLNISMAQLTRQFGRTSNRRKDTRRVLMPLKKPELLKKEDLIIERFLESVPLPADQKEIDEFIIQISNKNKIGRAEVLQILHPILSDPSKYINARLISLSQGGIKDAEQFEKTIKNIFELEFGYRAEWTGRMKRQGVGGYMDVFVVESGRNGCGIIDAKSTSNIYSLPHADFAKAVTTYIPHAKELYGRRDLEVKYISYISHLISSSALDRAKHLFSQKSVPVALISAYGLNRLRLNATFQKNPVALTDYLSSEPALLLD